MACYNEQLIRPLRNSFQNRSKHRLLREPIVIPEAVFIAVRLQVLRADRMIDPADSPLQ